MGKFFQLCWAILTTPHRFAAAFCIQMAIFGLQVAQLTTSHLIEQRFGKDARLINDAGWQFMIDGFKNVRNKFFDAYVSPFKEGWQEIQDISSDAGFGTSAFGATNKVLDWFEKGVKNSTKSLDDKNIIEEANKRLYKEVKNPIFADIASNSDNKKGINIDDIDLSLPQNITSSRNPGKGFDASRPIINATKSTSAALTP